MARYEVGYISPCNPLYSNEKAVNNQLFDGNLSSLTRSFETFCRGVPKYSRNANVWGSIGGRGCPTKYGRVKAATLSITERLRWRKVWSCDE